MCTELKKAIAVAYERGAEVSIHIGTGNYLIDGLRWDYWMRLKDREATSFRGRVLVKEK